LCNKTKRFDKAEEYYLRALEIRERLAKANPKAYEANVATIFNNLANLYRDTKRFDKAEDYYLLALEIRERLSKAHPEVYKKNVATTLNNLTNFYKKTHRFNKAEEYSREALKWSDNVGIYTNLAAAILLQGRFEEAKEIYLRYKDEKKESFLSDFHDLKENNAIPEHLMDDVEKIIELLQ
jgi:tetratricopeptide (TPR) repeat protein